ncbi:MAG: response regulator transcription factor, partial [bacterium]
MLSNSENQTVINVMVVEDDQLYRESIQELINENKHLSCSHACESCEDAFAVMEDDFVPEVVLLDIELPGMSGVEGIR